MTMNRILIIVHDVYSSQKELLPFHQFLHFQSSYNQYKQEIQAIPNDWDGLKTPSEQVSSEEITFSISIVHPSSLHSTDVHDTQKDIRQVCHKEDIWHCTI